MSKLLTFRWDTAENRVSNDCEPYGEVKLSKSHISRFCMLNVFLGLLPAWHDLHQQENTQRVANLGSHVTGLGAAKPDDGTSSAAPALYGSANTPAS